MLDKATHDNILRDIAESGGATENMLDLIQKLRDDYDERIGEDKFLEKIDWESKYKDLHEKYLDRFFTGEEKTTQSGEEIKKETKEDVKKDGENLSFETLFEKKEQ